MVYHPKPIDSSRIELSDEILQLSERLARNAHDIWAGLRLSEGWTWGPQRNDAEKKHPNLVPYEQLSEAEKEYDRKIVLTTLKAMIAFGYRIEKS
jgi:hypothetical protein